MAPLQSPSIPRVHRVVNSVFTLPDGVDVPMPPAPPSQAGIRATATAASDKAPKKAIRRALTRVAEADEAAGKSAPATDIDKLYSTIQGAPFQAITALDAALALHCTANQAQAKLEDLTASGVLCRSALRGGDWDLPRYEIPTHAGLCPDHAADPRILRQRLGLGLREFAATLGVHVETLLRWERHPHTISSPGRALLRLINAMPHSALGILRAAGRVPESLTPAQEVGAQAGP